MADTFFDKIYKSKTSHTPDVLSCLANLSNDEVFTPPGIVNQMLDLLPQELFRDPNTTFLDPACKTGVFLREIAKRLIVGLQDKIPDLQQRIDHIFHKQLYGIAITELTSLLSRRSLYCSKYPNGEYSVSRFDTVEGNIRFRRIQHTWVGDKCKFCGASKDQWDRGEGKETHAYEFIHTSDPEKIFNMKFDVIISNPPYQMTVNESGRGLGAVPIYHKFVEQAQKLKSTYLLMIIPSRWFAGGVGLDSFRKKMLNDTHLSHIVDNIDSNNVFPGVDINGGVCYFLRNIHYNGKCAYTNIGTKGATTTYRKLNEYDIFIRRNEALSIIQKVLAYREKKISDGGCSPQTPYGFLSTYTGKKQEDNEYNIALLSSTGWYYVKESEVIKSKETIDMFKPMISKLSCEHAGNPDKNGKYRVISRTELLLKRQICSQSYLVICPSKDKAVAKNTLAYLKTKFVRFLILQTLVGMNISIKNFVFVPWLDFSKPWTDEELYKKYGLTQEEIDFIESMIKPME